LEGSVQKAGDSLRVTAQLLDAKDGTHLWAESYDRELSTSNIFAIQDEVTAQVVATIAGSFGVISRARSAEVRRKPTESLDAYECVLRWAAYDRGNYVASEHAKVRDGLERAVRSDPGYTDAWAFLSFTYLDEYRANYNPRPKALDRALEAARRAVSLDPTSQNAHYALAFVYFFRKELDAFRAEAERTIALNPNNASVLAGLGLLLHNTGDERGVVLARKGEALDPFHPTWFHHAMAQYHFDRGEYEEALVEALKADIPGDFWEPLFLAVIYAELGKEIEARSAVEELLRLYPGFTVEKYIEEERKWNRPDAAIAHWASALRKAGLPE
jgi:tetratricopeptide (TPR) repeat protein